MSPLTFEAAKALVPEYIMLRHGTRINDGDQYFLFNLRHSDNEEGWLPVEAYHLLSIGVVMPTMLIRRPIPESVRDDIAYGIVNGFTDGIHNDFETWLLEQSR